MASNFFSIIWWRIKHINWENFILIILAIVFFAFVLKRIPQSWPLNINTELILTNLLTINGIFSAVLLTYLFTRLTWNHDTKLDLFNECIKYSQKITEFRRILDRLTKYYNVWDNEDATKRLLDHGKYSKIDFYEFRQNLLSNNKTKNAKLIDELYNNASFSDGRSSLYLAMASMVHNRRNDFTVQSELLNDFEIKGIYTLEALDRWYECPNKIWYSMNNQNNWINYNAFSVPERDYIMNAAIRLNPKFQTYHLNNNLIAEMASEIGDYVFIELRNRLLILKKGIEGLNMTLVVLIFSSLLFGVLIPFFLLISNSNSFLFQIIVWLVASINASLIFYFILKLPFLINRELKWD